MREVRGPSVESGTQGKDQFVPRGGHVHDLLLDNGGTGTGLAVVFHCLWGREKDLFNRREREQLQSRPLRPPLLLQRSGTESHRRLLVHDLQLQEAPEIRQRPPTVPCLHYRLTDKLGRKLHGRVCGASRAGLLQSCPSVDSPELFIPEDHLGNLHLGQRAGKRTRITLRKKQGTDRPCIRDANTNKGPLSSHGETPETFGFRPDAPPPAGREQFVFLLPLEVCVSETLDSPLGDNQTPEGWNGRRWIAYAQRR
mmetsp:Transcript_39580/g.77915  ORF Transcript_39580/g.77915 Transcript_39580/m.77915 type:complete len:254 (+) Transcript_39580:217-978(+)